MPAAWDLPARIDSARSSLTMPRGYGRNAAARIGSEAELMWLDVDATSARRAATRNRSTRRARLRPHDDRTDADLQPPGRHRRIERGRRTIDRFFHTGSTTSRRIRRRLSPTAEACLYRRASVGQANTFYFSARCAAAWWRRALRLAGLEREPASLDHRGRQRPGLPGRWLTTRSVRAEDPFADPVAGDARGTCTGRSIPYFDGPRYPHLVRVDGKPDRLSDGEC